MIKTGRFFGIVPIALIFFMGYLPWQLYAQYEQEVQDQVNDLLKRHETTTDEVYFHDMGIVARKSDLAELSRLTTTIVRTHLMEAMKKHIQTQVEEINQAYFSDPYRASQELLKLVQYQKYFSPTEEYRMTAEGRSIASELGQLRERSLEQSRRVDDQESLLMGIEAVRRTGLFETRSSEEIQSMRSLIEDVQCGISWKSKINYQYQRKFETDYEKGTIEEVAQLKLVTSGKDLSQAKWVGEWVYHIKGKEGTADAVSQATLTYARGKDIADLVITYAKVSSVGRMNMPIPVAGDRRTFEITGTPIRPRAEFTGGFEIELAGCRENTMKSDA